MILCDATANIPCRIPFSISDNVSNPLLLKASLSNANALLVYFDGISTNAEGIPTTWQFHAVGNFDVLNSVSHPAVTSWFDGGPFDSGDSVVIGAVQEFHQGLSAAQQYWSIAQDTDGDGVPDLSDNCPFTPNGPLLGTCMGPPGSFGVTCHVNGDCGAGGTCDTAQTDRGGVNTATPDGIGDACQCGDVNNDGIVNNTDITLIKRAAAGLAPYPGGVTTLPGYPKCQVVNGAPGLSCNNAQAGIISRAVAGLGPGIVQGCHAATIFP